MMMTMRKNMRKEFYGHLNFFTKKRAIVSCHKLLNLCLEV